MSIEDKIRERMGGKGLQPLVEEENNNNVSSSFSKPPIPSSGSSSSGNNNKYSPLKWNDFFDSERQVVIPSTGDTFQVYVCDRPTENSIVFVSLHGASHSALSWAPAAKELKSAKAGGVVAIDFRGHGKTKTQEEETLSAEILAADITNVLNILYDNKLPPIMLVGHSMGGGIAARIASSSVLGSSLKALCVVDVVEGSALAALRTSKAFFDTRPQSFQSIEEAIKWSHRSGGMKNIESARVTVPAQLVFESSTNQYLWRTDMTTSEPFWAGWFQGLSTMFLNSPCPKLLILAGRDRLDVPLMTGQMQGKFQLIVFPECGHMVQEDQPIKLAQALNIFSQRFFSTAIKLPAKVVLS
eukprot:c14647_g1_i1.p1 GENE.c14647_g1_i1~~c14647_g1_i1.p1  ORF type:complete len:363 (-),score=165.81 c14647_g1_i1:23-1090(-)